MKEKFGRPEVGKYRRYSIPEIDMREAPVFASFSGMDLLGKGIAKGFRRNFQRVGALGDQKSIAAREGCLKGNMVSHLSEITD